MKRIILAAVAAVSLAGGAYAGETGDLTKASCLSELNMPAAVCDCMAAHAEGDLNEGEQAFFIAMIQGDDAAAASLRSTLTIGEMTHVAEFATTMPTQCTKEAG